MKPSEVSINLHNAGIHEIRFGEALAIEIPEKVDIKGNILCPQQWAETHSPMKDFGYVVYSISKRMIKYTEDKNNPRSAVIHGDLLLNPEISEIGINSDKVRRTNEMSDLIKRNRHIVVGDPHELISGLKNFSAKVTKKVEQSGDQRGNKKQAFEQEVISEIPSEFTVKMPVFIGFPPFAFKVEVCIDSRDAGIDVWLESNELRAIISENTDNIISDALAIFRQAGVPVMQLS